jgi:acetyl esterase/lipase
MNFRRFTIASLSVVLFTASDFAAAQNDPTAAIVHVTNAYQVIPNIVYRTASNFEAKLDLYQPRGLTAANPVLMFFHGGGWTAGTKEASALNLLPFLQTGWTVVNVEYRMTNVAPAPAAVEDARCGGCTATRSSTTSTRRRS